MRPLSRSIRSKLFLFSVAVFVVGVPLLIGYSSGYRFDTVLTLAKTGGIFIHSDVGNTEVFVDGELVEKNGALLKNTLVQNLTPYEWYMVEVQREGYHSWRKYLPVGPNIVTEGTVLMVPEVLPWLQVAMVKETMLETATTSTPFVEQVATTTEKEVVEKEEVILLPKEVYTELEDFFANPSRGDFYTVTGTTTAQTADGIATTTDVYGYVFPEWIETVLADWGTTTAQTHFYERNGLLTWLENGNVHARWLKETELPPFYFCIPEKEEGLAVRCENEQVIDWENAIQRYELFPNRDDVLLLQVEQGVYAVELDGRSERNIQPIYIGDVAAFHVTERGDIVVQNKDGVMYQTNI